MVVFYHIVVRVVESAERCYQRGALCTLALCLRLYCGAYPLSAAGCRELLVVALVCTIYVAFDTYAGLWWADSACRSVMCEKLP